MLRFLFPLVLGLAGAGLLIGLGFWQLERRTWKEAILADLSARIAAPPVAIPARPDPVADRYLAVRATGTTGGRELRVLVSHKSAGAGFRIVTALETTTGRRLLLDRGFVPAEAKDSPRPAVTAAFAGNLHWPEERDRFTPPDDPAANWWYARDVGAMAAALGTEPVLVVAAASQPSDPDVTPLPVGTEGIPNDHLGYAIQWFGLAAVWLGMTGYWILRLARRGADAARG
jgi:surfeit locus 1 family protein